MASAESRDEADRLKSSLFRRSRIAFIDALAGAAFGIAYLVALGTSAQGSVVEGGVTGALIASGIGLLESLAAASCVACRSPRTSSPDHDLGRVAPTRRATLPGLPGSSRRCN